MHPDDPDLAEMRDKLRLMKGVMYWRLSESFKARLWNERRSVKELEASLIETQKRAVQVRQARAGVPTNTGAFADRVAATRARMDELQERLARSTGQAERTICRTSRSRSWGARSSASRPIKFRRASSWRRSTTRPRTSRRRNRRQRAPDRQPPADKPKSKTSGWSAVAMRPALSAHRAGRRAAAFGRCGRIREQRADHQGSRKAQQVDVSPDPPQGRRQQQDHGKLQALSRLERRRRRVARGGDAPAGRSESRELGVGAHRARARDQRGPARDRGDPSLLGIAQDLSQVRAQRLGALSAGARLRAQCAARQGARDARPAGGDLSEAASTSTRRSSAAARFCSRTSPTRPRRPPTRR